MNKEKRLALENLLNNPGNEKEFYCFLDYTGDMKLNYRDYLITEPINCDQELERVPEADYELCTALLTMLLREDHFCNGSFIQRCQNGQVDILLSRMIALLS